MPLFLEEELLEAVRQGSVEDVSKLLECGADPNAGLFGDSNALSLAIGQGSQEITDLLLQHGRGRLCCVMEERASDQKPPSSRTTLSPIALTVRNGARDVGLILAQVFVLRRLAKLPMSWSLRASLIYGSQHVWFVMASISESTYTSTSFVGRWRNPYTYFDALIWMGANQRISNLFTNWLLPSDRLSSPLLSYWKDIGVAIPLRFSIELATTMTQQLLVSFGLLNQNQDRNKWTGEAPKSFDLESWHSPAFKIIDTIEKSSEVTEEMVMGILSSGLLVSLPYNESLAARVLLKCALKRSWTKVAGFLVDTGTLAESRPASMQFDQMRWPSAASAILYAWESASPDNIALERFHGPSIWTWCRDYLDPEEIGSYNYYLILVSSYLQEYEQGLSTPLLVDTYMTMIDILEIGGANVMKTDSQGRDVLKLMVVRGIRGPLFQRILQLWKQAREERGTETTSAALYEAVNHTKPDLQTVMDLLNAGISPSWENDEGRTPLFAAAYMNIKTDTMKLLIDRGADPNIGGSQGYPPIQRTLDDSSYAKFVFLLDNGVSPNLAMETGKTLLEVVLDLEPSLIVLKGRLVEQLILRGCKIWDPETTSSTGWLKAVSLSNLSGWSEKILETLFSHIPDNYQQAQLNAALQVAAFPARHTILDSCDLFTVFYLIRKGANPYLVQKESDTLLHRISDVHVSDHNYRNELKGILFMKELDVDILGEKGKSPLHLAVEHGSRDLVLLLLQHGASPNHKDRNGSTPLQLLCSQEPRNYTIGRSWTDVQGDEEAARFRGVRGQAAWGFELRRRHLDIKESLEKEEIFQALVDHGANLHIRDEQTQTLLMLACQQGNAVLAANILFSVGEDRFVREIHRLEKTGKTAVHIAAAKGDVDTLKVLMYPRNVLVREVNGWRYTAGLFERGQPPLPSDEEHDKAKEREIRQQEEDAEAAHEYMPSFLQHSFVNMTAPEDVQLTVGEARLRGGKDAIEVPNVECSEWLLLKEECCLYSKRLVTPKSKRTPLHYAAAHGHLEAVKLLVAHTSIDVDARDGMGKTAADWALQNDFYDVHYLLENSEADESRSPSTTDG